jgi:coenzyme F420-0:L-glutamate ligase / coenzyme F420-1:gamma-L-glutamate ligase
MAVIDVDAASALDRVLAARRSIRSYQDCAVPPELVDEIVAAARHAPSPHHSVPWRFAILTGDDAKGRLAAGMGERWRQDLGRDGLPADEIETEVGKSTRRLTRAPLVLIGSLYLEPLDSYPDPGRQQAETYMAAHSLGAALQNVMLAAAARGLASCWMCAPVFCPEVVRDALELPTALIPHALLTVGYPAKPPPERERPTLDQIVALRA